MNQYHADGYPELYRLSNLDENGKPNGKHPDKGTLAWHTDGSWSRVTGQATIIYGEVVPEIGGETHFCDMYGAYERLSAAWKARIANLRAVHNLDFSRTRRHGIDLMTEEQKRDKPPVDQPIVRTHPETGRKCIYLGDHAEYIVGMPYDEGRALIEELNALAVHPDLTYEHRWKPGELIAWDNRCVMHRATAYDPATQRRVVRRCTVLGEVPHYGVNVGVRAPWAREEKSGVTRLVGVAWDRRLSSAVVSPASRRIQAALVWSSSPLKNLLSRRNARAINFLEEWT